MVNFSTAGLEGLFDLDRKGVDIRPTLLRVLTDQYLSSPVHSLDEERHYTELAMRLIDETDIATRAAVSVRLAPQACAPRPIILQLARDVLEVAEPVLLHAPGLTVADCDAIIAERGQVYAEILKRRGKTPGPPPAATPSPKRPPMSAEAFAAALQPLRSLHAPAGTPAPTSSVTADDGASAAVATPETAAGQAFAATATGETLPAAEIEDAAARELSELFFAAGSSERRLILISLDFAAWPGAAPPAALQRSDIWRMETAALRHHTATLIRELERALGFSQQLARRVIEDDQGEPIVAAAKAMAMPADVLQRIVLFLNPRVGQSVDRVYQLSSLYTEISVEAARRLVAILRAAAPRDARDALGTGSSDTARRALSESVPAPARRAPAVSVTPAKYG